MQSCGTDKCPEKRFAKGLCKRCYGRINTRRYREKPEVRQRQREAAREYLKRPGVKEHRRAYARAHRSSPHTRFITSRIYAENRKLSFTLTEDEYTQLITKPCHYCCGPLNPTRVGLDRKDNSRGYDNDNVLPCCGQCNRIRSDVFTVEQMEEIGKLIAGFKRVQRT